VSAATVAISLALTHVYVAPSSPARNEKNENSEKEREL
jgi:methylphosphotriester-DNA--protein-cysteine methyltransferase